MCIEIVLLLQSCIYCHHSYTTMYLVLYNITLNECIPLDWVGV